MIGKMTVDIVIKAHNDFYDKITTTTSDSPIEEILYDGNCTLGTFLNHYENELTGVVGSLRELHRHFHFLSAMLQYNKQNNIEVSDCLLYDLKENSLEILTILESIRDEN